MLLTALMLGALAAPMPVAVLDIPFDDVSGLVCFEVRLPGSPPLSALLDTGFNVSLLDTAAAARLGLSARDVQKRGASSARSSPTPWTPRASRTAPTWERSA